MLDSKFISICDRVVSSYSYNDICKSMDYIARFGNFFLLRLVLLKRPKQLKYCGGTKGTDTALSWIRVGMSSILTHQSLSYSVTLRFVLAPL